MRRRNFDNQGEAIGLFPFLAVLLCTMGALLVLLVILSQHVQRKVASRQAEAIAAPQASVTQDTESNRALATNASDLQTREDAQAIAARLELARQRQAEFDRLRQEAEERCRDEQLRLSHVEEHTRRIEHELALLHLAHEQLKATESKQTVDQEQAEKELNRLRQIVKETEERLVDLRSKPLAKKSFAIVPYRGPNGTFRQPIYIECTKRGVILQPEGILLGDDDFVRPVRAGNPLAAALRAAREHLNQQARLRGEPEPPDPYPLLLVRPDGSAAYAAALAAIRTWDASFGYEFVEDDWDLQFDEADPRLAQVMLHSVEQARERQAMLARLAPSRYRRISRSAAGGASGLGGSGGMGQQGFGGNGRSEQASRDGSGEGSAPFESSNQQNGLQPDQLSPGNAAGAYAQAETTVPGGGWGGHHGGGNADAQQAAGDRYGADASGGGQSEGGAAGSGGPSQNASEGDAGAASLAGGAAGGGGQASGQAGGSSSSGSSQSNSGSPAQAGGATRSVQFSRTKSQVSGNLARSRGKDWAVGPGVARSASAVRRPIRVRVGWDRLAVVPSRHSIDPSLAEATVVSLHQPAERVADELVAALRSHMQEWGLAGRGLYWRPVLVLDVAPGGQANGEQLAELLGGSGIEVQLPEIAQRPTEAGNHATR